MQSYGRGHSLSWTAKESERLEAALWAPALAYPSTDAKAVAGPWHTCRQVALLPARTLHGSLRSQSALPAHAPRSPSGRAVAVGSRGRRRADLLPTRDLRDLRASREPASRSAPNERSAH